MFSGGPRGGNCSHERPHDPELGRWNEIKTKKIRPNIKSLGVEETITLQLWTLTLLLLPPTGADWQGALKCNILISLIIFA